MTKDKHKHTNALIHESSPYLLQHAHNPVNWVNWSESAFEKAKEENKLVLISVGYSSCHWCHVMEKESFEDEEVAAYMNMHFICIKVDREERPDVDQVYMNAVQLMTQRGGWPLNCFALPDGRPIYGGTYFPQEQWLHVLRSLVHTYTTDPQRVEEYARTLKEGIEQSELIEVKTTVSQFEEERLHELVTRWKHQFDDDEGGANRAPKFPLPNNYRFLLRYAMKYEDPRVKRHALLTLTKMAQGGIYDQIGGGFARYSVDTLWKVPHFEKMLYDNAQLLSLYADGYKLTQDPEYLQVIRQTVTWLKREMLDPSGSFYSALDADSEGEEGKYYVWSEQELKELLRDDYTWFADLFEVENEGVWEEDKSILLRKQSLAEFAQKSDQTIEAMTENVNRAFDILLQARTKRIPPGLDDKSLTSWNAMLISGLCDAYSVTGDPEYIQLAMNCAEWIKNSQTKEEGTLWHTWKNGRSSIDGFLEDYAFVINAWISLYTVTFDEQWLLAAKALTETTIEQFEDEKSGMFFFTDKDSELIVRKMEINDNVIPSTNSQMANNLFLLGKYFSQDEWTDKARQMLANVYDGMENYGSGYSNWAWLLMNFSTPFYETVIGGKDWKSSLSEWNLHYIPESIVCGGNQQGELEITVGKLETDKNKWYVCENKSCQAPVSSFDEAFRSIKTPQ